MKIDINAHIEMEFAEVMAACLESAAKKKVADEVKIQVKDTFGTVGLEELNKTLKSLESNKEYLEKATWEQLVTHNNQLWKLLSNGVISCDEWEERTNFIMNVWHSRSMNETKNN